MEIQHFSHKHGLTSFEVDMMMRKRWEMSRTFKSPSICNCCNQAILGAAYFCETCEDFWLHKSCFLLPHELQNHPLHSTHPLILVAKPPQQKFGSSEEFFVCEECRDISPGFAYHCAECQFNVDIKCALSEEGEHHRLRRIEMKYEIEHWSDKHILILINFASVGRECDCSGCEMEIQGLAYVCFDCDFYLHKSCAEMPQEIQHHPHHSSHPLLFQYGKNRSGKFICDGCRGISSGFVYQCEPCSIKLDVKCALLIEGGNNVIEAGQALERRKTEIQILHFSHRHMLFLVDFRKEQSYGCTGGESKILGLGYACLECEFYLHKSCAEMPREIQRSYHPLHPLRAQIGKYDRGVCAACKATTQDKEIVYNCAGCSFTLHMTCTKFSLVLTPPLKHNCHAHSLYYIVGQDTLLNYRFSGRKDRVYVCDICGKGCKGPSYICLECTSSFHINCIPIPEVVFNCDFHMHSLSLRDPVIAEIEDDSTEYYCFACEEERNPRYHAYYCDQFPYTAQIECMVSEFADQGHFSRSWTSRNVDETAEEKRGDTEYPTLAEYTVPQCRRQTEIRDFGNDHTMLCHEIDLYLKQCYYCKIEFCGTAYTCEACNISFHKACAELPPKIRHPLHLLNLSFFFKLNLPMNITNAKDVQVYPVVMLITNVKIANSSLILNVLLWVTDARS